MPIKKIKKRRTRLAVRITIGNIRSYTFAEYMDVDKVRKDGGSWEEGLMLGLLEEMVYNMRRSGIKPIEIKGNKT